MKKRGGGNSEAHVKHAAGKTLTDGIAAVRLNVAGVPASYARASRRSLRKLEALQARGARPRHVARQAQRVQTRARAAFVAWRKDGSPP
jgi:hypothetical protein